MTALSITKQALSAFRNEKPHSSITDLVEILTSPSYEEEAFDGIPELIESINLQPTGPTEASRAIRKKLKHGDTHRQYRALVLLKATVDNGGDRFLTTFADGQLTDAIRNIVSNPGTDQRVKRKLISILAAWHKQFQNDPHMSPVANLYKTVPHSRPAPTGPPPESLYDKRKREEREAKDSKKKAKEEERLRKEQELKDKRASERRSKRPPFDFEKEKPQILQAIAETSQCANNLLNALTLVNPEHEKVQDNAKVQECLEKAKASRKRVVRYIQLVENEEFIGTLLETNERVIAALQMYDKLSKPVVTDQDIEEIQAHMAAANLSSADSGELSRLQQKQRAAVARHRSRATAAEDTYPSPPNSAGLGLHPDLQELSFGEIGSSSKNLPPPIRPDRSDSDDEYTATGRGSLSDFSDYDDSDEESHNRQVASSSSRPTSGHYTSTYSSGHAGGISDSSYGGKAYTTLGSNSLEELDVRKDPKQGLLLDSEADEDDPFADPFADQQEVMTPGIVQKAGMNW